MTRYIITSTGAINLDGIRGVTIHDFEYSNKISIIIQYKGNNINLSYSTREERNKVFNEICTGLEERNRTRAQK